MVALPSSAATARDLEGLIPKRATAWAVSRMQRLIKGGTRAPAEWPGTLDEARGFVDELAGQRLEDAEREALALMVERRARLAWRESRDRG